jgi:hypothetical protein
LRMLRDAGIAGLKRDLERDRIGEAELDALVSAILGSKDGELRHGASWLKRRFERKKLITLELKLTRRYLLDGLLNIDRNWRREPRSVRQICESAESRFWWMRYDLPRVKLMFESARMLVLNDQFRGALRRQTYLPTAAEYGQQLSLIEDALEKLLDRTVYSIETGGRSDGLVDRPKGVAYARQAEDMIREFVAGRQGPPS